jgi:hypothetical protein
MNCILLSEFVGWYVIYKNVHGVNKNEIELHVGNVHSLSSPVHISTVLKILHSICGIVLV